MSDKLDYKQAAELLGVPLGTLYAWVCRSHIPHHRYGRRLIRFSKQELETWMAKHHVLADEKRPKGLINRQTANHR